MSTRENWSSKYGFVLACIGAAMGLGSIWMFPWRLGQFGGAAFLVPYFFFIFGLAVIGLMGEFAFGRSQQSGSIGAFEKVLKAKNKDFGAALGLMPVCGVTGVFIFYLIVVGWILKYLFLALTGAFSTMDLPAYFDGFAGQPESIFWHALALLLTLAIVRLGIKNGIEKANKIMMPMLFFILVILMVRSLTLPGSMEGVKFILFPQWSYLLEPMTWVMALGMAFFTVCLGGAAMVVYGSYLGPNVDIPSSAINTAVYTTIASLLAAFVTIPAAFAFGLSPGAGPPLLFITVPKIFTLMTGGYFFGLLFFISVLFAAVTSAVNLMEVPVEALMERFNITRTKSTIIVALLGFVAGIPLDLDMNRFGMFADFVSVYLIPAGAVLAAIMFFWVYGVSKAREQINQGAAKPLGSWFEPLAKYLFTGIAIFVLVMGIIVGGF